MFEKLEKDIDYTFCDKKLLQLAMTHPSHAGQTHVHNQRLEFLGDAVLQLTMSARLYHQYPDLQEGQLSKLRARCVQEGALEVAARKLHLGDYLVLGHGEDKGGGREKPSILADAFEALLGAMYLDGAMEQAERLVKTIIPIQDLPKVHDYKTEYQELAQSVAGVTPVYRIVSEEGPAHAKQFSAEVTLNGKVTGQGSGSSKKQAEQQAARAALQKQGL